MKEQLYQDFVNKILPKIQEGLSISKDYFFDLFGRYVKYLIVSDSIGLLFSIISGIVGWKSVQRARKIDQYDDARIGWFMLGVSGLLFGIIGTLFYLNYLAKDIFIPEIRVWQSLSGYSQSKP